MDQHEKPILAYASPAKRKPARRWWLRLLLALTAAVLGGLLGTLVAVGLLWSLN